MKVRVAAILIQDHKLLTMRYHYGGQDLYNLPGGNLEFGEEMRGALARELDEELQIKTSIAEDSALIAEVHNEKGDTLHVLYEAQIVSGTPVLNPKETTALEAVWLPLEKLEEVNMYPAVSKQIKNWKAGLLKERHIGEIEQVWL
ncbi:NUDIX domain-containing protein [Jiulongibacter sediminis]|jgi:ADP-ribose pyrophosphatase YjhB (NUDIX family)|uniref:NUDIX domain-containing protein n=1 Tax=Jiulongibacter sediminis TaxID=1605367 RepID=UPI0026EAC877|nr:NUDIX domain-containing protein [Jiulongibacter sediminis]